MNAPLYSAMGKEVLRDGQHFADCRSTDEAWAMAALLRFGQIVLWGANQGDAKRISKVLWG